MAKQISINISRLDIASGHQPPSVASASLLVALKNANLEIDKKIMPNQLYLSVYGNNFVVNKINKKFFNPRFEYLENKMKEMIQSHIKKMQQQQSKQ